MVKDMLPNMGGETVKNLKDEVSASTADTARAASDALGHTKSPRGPKTDKTRTYTGGSEKKESPRPAPSHLHRHHRSSSRTSDRDTSAYQGSKGKHKSNPKGKGDDKGKGKGGSRSNWEYYGHQHWQKKWWE